MVTIAGIFLLQKELWGRVLLMKCRRGLAPLSILELYSELPQGVDYIFMHLVVGTVFFLIF